MNDEFDVNMLLIFKIYDLRENSKLTQRINKCKMLTNSAKQLDNHLKDVYKFSLLVCVFKHHVSHWKLHVTMYLLQLFSLWVVTITTLTKTAISHSEIIVQRCLHTLSTHHDQVPKNSSNGVASIQVYWGTLCCFGKTLLHNCPHQSEICLNDLPRRLSQIFWRFFLKSRKNILLTCCPLQKENKFSTEN